MRSVLAGLLALSLAACSEGNPIAPPSGPDEVPAALAEAPLRDALERIVPSLGGSPAATALRAALADAVDGQGAAAVPAIESALAQLEAEQPDAAVEADVIRLALSAQPRLLTSTPNDSSRSASCPASASPPCSPPSR